MKIYYKGSIFTPNKLTDKAPIASYVIITTCSDSMFIRVYKNCQILDPKVMFYI